jgi:hypothetical protein
VPSKSVISEYIETAGSTADFTIPDTWSSCVITGFTAIGNGGEGHAILVYQGNNMFAIDVDGDGYIGGTVATRIGMEPGDVVHVTTDVNQVFANVTVAFSYA